MTRTIEKLESSIVTLEAKEKELKGKLEQASCAGNGKEIEQYSMEIHQTSQAIEKAFEELSVANDALTTLKKQ